jgi:dolichyl-phosphate-mannose-protein mannosyltransferase
MKLTLTARVERVVIILLVLVGVVLRLRQYAANRSLWLDESFLALGIIGPNFAGFLEPLRYGQVAPPGFVLGQRVIVDLFGPGEYALRALPIVAAIVALFLFWRFARAILPTVGAMLALAIFAISPPLTLYAVEAKQYSTDVAVGVMLWWLMTALKPALDADRPAAWALMMAVGAAAIWASHPAIFIIGAFAFESALRTLWGRSWRAFSLRIAAGLVWVAAFVALYLVSLRFVQVRMYADWRGAAAPLAPSSFAAINEYAVVVWTLSALPLGSQVAQLITLAAAIGVVALGRFAPRLLAWFAGAFLLAWVASTLRHYPVATRLWLFFTPVVVILAAAGVEEVWRRTRNSFPALAPILACLMFAYPSLVAARGIVVPRLHEEIRPLLVHVRQHYRADDVIYVYREAQYAAAYYAALGLALPGRVVIGTTTDEADMAKLRGHSRVWLLFSHVVVSDGMNEERHFLRLLDGVGRRIEERQETGASVYLYDLATAVTRLKDRD